MKPSESASKGGNNQSHGGSFAKVLDARKQAIRGPWVRNERYYAQLKVENPVTGVKKTRRVPLVDKDGHAVETAAQAVAELKRLQTQRAENTLPVLERTPTFGDYAKRYVDLNQKLEAHLLDKQSRRQPDSQWLFRHPSAVKKTFPQKPFGSRYDQSYLEPNMGRFQSTLLRPGTGMG